ncbi:helix-turn-helix domain-containing protein [Natrinema marinum]|uniref:helix-turn-helix domain-containing protein n=1 Tax=Natrinema marinum TaxID=2961598 RepID=UPI0020C8905E|nr:helix-turn-helix domain-containing protein [Natrinema marinum]
MSVIAEFTIKSSEFILGQVLARDPETHIEMERVVPASGRVMPYLWVHGGHFEEFEAAVRSSDHVKKLTALDVVEDDALYRVEWEDPIESLIYGMSETDATILEARGNEKWYFRIRFDTHAGLTQFHNYCTSHEIRFQLNRVYTLEEEQQGSYAFNLSDAQRRTLVLAVENGYFEVPRRATLGDLGGELGITEQSASENVRRGADRVLKKVLLERSAADVQE